MQLASLKSQGASTVAVMVWVSAGWTCVAGGSTVTVGTCAKGDEVGAGGVNCPVRDVVCGTDPLQPDPKINIITQTVSKPKNDFKS
jgi:hypothetical protein